MFSSDDYIAIGADEEELGSQIEEDILCCTSVCSRTRVFFKSIDNIKLPWFMYWIFLNFISNKIANGSTHQCRNVVFKKTSTT